MCIGDGSTDNTKGMLKKLASERPYMKPLFFTKNYGQSSAFDAGFKAAGGEYVITLDGDGQNDPADIPKLYFAIQEADLVCGVRKKRKDTFVKRIISRCANWVRSRVCNDGMQDTGCSLKIYRTSCLRQIKMYNGMHRFLPALFKIEGFRIHQTPVNHRERLRGKSNYNFFNRSLNTLADLWAVRWMKNRHLSYQTESTILER
ncbi:MAG: glycosyltransferase family 2 protein [Parachlamydia sp.]|nr:glycosyltransferase family 2 protein [Parachlamydia sp.]